jgi:branched-chain amino acid transport system substrate-binding protein
MTYLSLGRLQLELRRRPDSARPGAAPARKRAGSGRPTGTNVAREAPGGYLGRRLAVVFLVLVAFAVGGAPVTTASTSGGSGSVIKIGAIYPLKVGGAPAAQEFDGVQTAFRLVNKLGGINGRKARLILKNVDANNGPNAVFALAHEHVTAIIGSESSLVGIPVSQAAQAAHVVYLEAGAVATMLTAKGQPDVFRTVVTGQTLGRSAADFAAHAIAPRVDVPVRKLRVAVVYINDVYGASVGRAQVAETHRLGMKLVGVFRYQEPGANMAQIVADVKRSRPNVVLVAAYLQDGIEFRLQTLRQHLRVDAMIGTSSSFCMPAFGNALGWKAVGLFAADKPDTTVNPRALDPAARALRTRAESLYHKLFRQTMTGPSVAGFVAGWVLLHQVLPHASSLQAAAVRKAFLSLNLPYGSEINGAGVYFARPGAGDGGQNLRATSVIWQWLHPRRASIVYPPGFADSSPRFIPLPAHP